ncbi:MAG: CRP/FNR family cyclic AMP-dependent transcriptional regulator [Motiliproteus sp.]
MDINQEVELLRSIPLLSKLDSSKLKLLAFTSRLVEYPDGAYLFRKQDPVDAVYLIMRGEAEVISSDLASTEPQVAVVRAEGDLIGEIAVLSRQGRTASVRARGELVVLYIEGDMFVQLLTCNPDVALDVMHQLSDKLAQAHVTNNKLQQALSAGSS